MELRVHKFANVVSSLDVRGFLSVTFGDLGFGLEDFCFFVVAAEKIQSVICVLQLTLAEFTFVVRTVFVDGYSLAMRKLVFPLTLIETIQRHNVIDGTGLNSCENSLKL